MRVTTPQNALSVLVPKYDDDILSALDPRFFTESFDAVAYMLVSQSHALYACVLSNWYTNPACDCLLIFRNVFPQTLTSWTCSCAPRSVRWTSRRT